MIRICLKWIGRTSLVVAGLALLAVAALWLRLAYGPVSVSFANDRLTQAANDALGDWQLQLSDSVLAYEDGWIGLQLRDVALLSQSDTSQLTIDRLGIRLSGRALLQGQIRLKQLVFFRPSLTIPWSLDDLISGQPTPTANANSSDDAALVAIAELFAENNDDGNGALSGLREILVTGADLSFVETASSRQWRIPDADMSLRRTRGGVSLEIDGSLQHGAAESPVSLSLRRQADQSHRLRLRIDGFEPHQAFAGMEARINWHAIAVPVSLQAEAFLDRNFAVKNADATILAGRGTVSWPPMIYTAKPVRGADIRLQYDGRRLSVDQFDLALLETNIRLGGEVDLLDPESPVVKLYGGFDQLPVRDLVRYWPGDLADGGRKWIDRNISEGLVTEGDLVVDTSGDTSGRPVRLSFRFDELVTSYLPGMPSAIGLTGMGELTDLGLHLQIDKGSADGLPLAGTTVDLLDFDKPRNMADILIEIEGPVPDTLRLIDYPPLGFASVFGIVPNTTEGTASVRGRLRFPLIGDLTFAQVDVAVTGELDRVFLPLGDEGQALSEAALSLDVTQDRLIARGSGLLFGIASQFHWNEIFDPGDGQWQSVYDLTAKITPNELSRFGLDTGEIFTGQALAQLQFRGQGQEISEGRAALSLDQASLYAGLVNWRKPRGEPANLSLDVRREEGKFILSPILLSGKDVDGRAELAIDAKTGALAYLTVDRFVSPANSLSADYRRTGTGGTELHLNAKKLDLRGLLSGLGKLGADDAAVDQATPEQDAAIHLRAHADMAYGLNDVVFRNIDAEALSDGPIWQKIHLQAGVGQASEIRLSLEPRGGQRKLLLTADDAGETLRGLGLFANALGGELTASAELSLAGEKQFRAVGQFNVGAFKLVRGETIAAVIEAGEAEGLNGLVGEEGLDFDQLTLPFQVNRGVIDIRDAHANGGRLGLTMEGQIDQALDELSINGVIVPAYRLNSFVNNIPIIGQILGGGQGEGLFALSYRVRGDLADPEVKVSRLSALAPGIIRKIFAGRRGRLEDLADESEDGG